MDTDSKVNKILNKEHVRLTSMMRRVFKGAKGRIELQAGYSLQDLREFILQEITSLNLNLQDYPTKWVLTHKKSVKDILESNINDPKVFHAFDNLQIRCVGAPKVKEYKLITRKLSEENEQAILELLLVPSNSDSKMSQQAIASLFTDKLGYSVSRSLVSQIAIKNRINSKRMHTSFNPQS